MQRAIAAESELESVCHFERVLHSGCVSRSLRVKPDDVRNEPVIAGTQQPEHVNHAGKRSYSVCASAETKQIDTVSVFVYIHQIAVGVADVRQQPGSKGQAHHHGPALADLIMCGRRTHGAHPRMVVADLPLTIENQHTINIDDIRVVVPEFVSRSIAADNYILGHMAPEEKQS